MKDSGIKKKQEDKKNREVEWCGKKKREKRVNNAKCRNEKEKRGKQKKDEIRMDKEVEENM